MPTALARVPTIIDRAAYKAAFEDWGFELDAIRSLTFYRDKVVAEVYELNEDRHPILSGEDGQPVTYTRIVPVIDTT